VLMEIDRHSCVRRFPYVLLITLCVLFGALQPASAQKLDSIERQRAMEKLKVANSLGQAYGIIAQAVLDLNDSHTNFSPPGSIIRVEYGWEMKAVGDQCFIA